MSKQPAQAEYRALSITQPYAELILRPRRKKIEIRSWQTSYRGPLLIHASKKFWANEANEYGISKDEITLGAFVGIAYLDEIRPYTKKDAADLKKRRAGSGWWEPDQFAWVLRSVHRIKPIPFKGQLNLFKPPLRVLRSIERSGVPSHPVKKMRDSMQRRKKELALNLKTATGRKS